ncbi:MAG: cellulose biosynthesis cyclic di-GMP-binding regulatory protein BcsB [Devosia sp.]|uniref:cellulose biosynthesis cyclic di-GMP-binding regulatory protein BcsB n=1 Tax=Devosia sp. TaxID=1871048 RepID=UPI0024CAC6CD|nr:cellulose biosynthesis cyclic di-GMP-binding regulatory protein BcsB [Devosia sp.]UYN99169.1 MAG: cellulose biosynthesis cyclic di-GMP-binding regulatory protein BcsB [Devosia sp.]
MTRLATLSLAAMLAAAIPALAQVTPFDMSPESDRVTPETAPGDPAGGAVTPPPVAALAEPFARYLLPQQSMLLTGEESRTSMVVYLTEAQASAAARLEFGFLNSLVVAPEISNLRVRVNQTEIASVPLGASSAPAARAIDLPSGILRAGPNVVEFSSVARHRTDCSVASTYELWTELPAQNLKLVLDGDGVGQLTQLTDLAAVGVDETGATRVRLLTRELTSRQTATTLLGLSQALALALHVPQMHIEVADALSERYAAGVLDLVVMPAADLPESLAAIRSQAEAAPLAALVPLASGATTLVVSGPDWASVARAGEAVLASAGDGSLPRIDLADPHPMILSGQSVVLSDLAMPTAEFTGRRLTTEVQFNLPYDFYAYRYGELDLVLDAAYSADVLPGSEIDVYTNGQIASATPLLRTDGGQLRKSVIRIPMTSLRPGRNEAVIAVNVQSATDSVCSAGWTGQAPVRFVLSNSSELRFPDYARIGVVPDLLVLAGTGWPYTERESVPAVLGNTEDAVLSAMMLAARIAASSDDVIAFEVTDAASVGPGDDALIVMPLTEMPSPVVGRTGIAPSALRPSAEDDALNQFDTAGQQRTLPEPVQWALDQVGLQLADLMIIRPRDSLYVPKSDEAVLTQVRHGEGGLWTVLTASDNATLRSGTEQMIVTDRWREVSGRLAAISIEDGRVETLEATQPVLVETQPFSLTNLRLIAANWFSGNLLYFAAAVVLAAVILTFTSSLVLTQLGRRK